MGVEKELLCDGSPALICHSIWREVETRRTATICDRAGLQGQPLQRRGSTGT